MTEWDSLPSAESVGLGRTTETTPIHARRRNPLTVLTVGASPTTPALAAVTAVLQDTGAFIHTWAGFAEVDWMLGFCKGECAQAWVRSKGSLILSKHSSILKAMELNTRASPLVLKQQLSS